MGSYADYHGIELPATSDVRSGIDYGWAGNELSGVLIVGGGGGTYTAASNVRFGTDRGDGVVGTLRVPTISQVQNGVPVDAGVGLLTIPSVFSVRSGVVYGPPSAPLIGTLILPDISDVRLDVDYGASGTEFSGTLIVTGDGGSGTSFSIAIKDSLGNPIANCSCWVATDISGTNVITSVWDTDTNGIVNFVLEPGNYYLFRQKNGVSFQNNPRSFTVA